MNPFFKPNAARLYFIPTSIFSRNLSRPPHPAFLKGPEAARIEYKKKGGGHCDHKKQGQAPPKLV
jgi:hypothetical protein